MQKIRNRSDFDKLIEKIDDCYAWYNTKQFEDMVYNLKLDNGENLRICFTPYNCAHLLGIDTEYLKSTGLFKGSSNQILEQICNDSYRLYSLVQQGHLNYDNFISDFAFDKVSSFKRICGIDLYNIEFICKYSKDNSYITGSEQLEGDYYIAYKENDGLSIIGFKKNNNYYYPMTNRYVDYSSEESISFLNTLLTKQTITMPTYSSIYFKSNSVSTKPLFINYNKKSEIIRDLLNYADRYGAYVDVSVGYGYIINKLIQKFEDNSNLYPILNVIFDSISKRVKIDITKLTKEFYSLPKEIISLIDIYNNSIDQSINNALDERTKEIISERDFLREEREKQIKELKLLREELLKKEELIKKLNEENQYNRDAIDGAVKLLLKKNT